MNCTDIIQILVGILAIVAALTGAFVTIHLERNKDLEFKLQDRKDQWLEIHQEDIYEKLKALIGVLQGNSDLLYAKGLKVSYGTNSLTITNNVKENFPNELIAHLQPYKDINSNINDINDLINSLNSYIEGINNLYDKIIDQAEAEINSKFNGTIVPVENSNENGYNGYFQHYIFDYIIKKTVGKNIQLSKNENYKDKSWGNIHGLDTTAPPYYTVYQTDDERGFFFSTDENKAIKFKDVIMPDLTKKFSDTVMKLEKERKELDNKADKIASSLIEIKLQYEAGYRIGKSCHKCQLINDVKHITTLRYK
ncbi:hypothetical protein [Acidiplasma sp. MBA-1]|uniref:hypothetical protein n=1 Tax=Acidiplasma sp. MBA-1 TaxID=1293648 RepID=UPI0005EA2F20|nr:hypothetical protein [Acidiplasma sp. MBA-1]KJE49322.1 hypothetical protein TZ01_04515 [Acidiplasma sp. MBA-1]